MDKLQLKPTDAIALLKAAIEDNEPTFVGGPKGIGKSECGVRASKEANHDILISLPPVEDPTAAGGVPWPDVSSGRVKMLPYGRLAEAISCTRPTVWILDDLPHAPPAVQTSFMGLLWQPAGVPRQINGHLLPDHLKIVACGNLRQAGYGVHGMLQPVQGRFTLIEMVPDLDDFANYCIDTCQAPEHIAFIRSNPDLLCPEALDPNYKGNVADYENSPNPRNWIKAFQWQKRQGLKDHVRLAGMAGRVGLGPANMLDAYARMWQQMPSLDGILMDPDKAPIPKDELSVLYAIATGLAFKANQKNFDRVCRYAQRLYDAALGDFGVLIVRDSARREPKVQTTQAWNQVAASPLGRMFTGGDGDD